MSASIAALLSDSLLWVTINIIYLILVRHLMLLSDRSIKDLIQKGKISISPYKENLIQPSSYDVRLADKILVFQRPHHPYIDLKNGTHHIETLTNQVIIYDNRPFILHPGEFILASTIEKLSLPDDIAARLEGKSSLARLGILIHSTAGYIDPGFSGTITLEISNVANIPVTLYPNMAIGQLSFTRMDSPAEKPYGHKDLNSKYNNQEGPVASKFNIQDVE